MSTLRTPARLVLGLAATILLASGCASTRVARAGPIADGEALLTLVVTDDLTVVQRECRGIARVAGCFTSHMVDVGDGVVVKTLKIVRYADVLPSATALERDAAALCHAAADFQRIVDPCRSGSPRATRAPLRAEPSAVATR